MTNQADQTAQFTVPPVRKTRQVAWPPGEAFDRFCRIGDWWPLSSHSLGEAEAASVAFERLEVGGRLIERLRSGEAHVWGTIVAFDRPERLSFTWHVGREPDVAQLIELTFQASGAGTLVELTHAGWERLGERAVQLRDNYDHGWEPVMDHYATGATERPHQAPPAA